MNLDSELIFIVGPGSVGKSTVGKLLAEKIGFGFVDIDEVFCERIELIGDYIQQQSYPAYCEANSKLFEDLIREHPRKIVFPLSSGFLVHEQSPELVAKHQRLLQQLGVSILLLPSQSLTESMEIVIPRQMGRGYPDLNEEIERARFAARYPRYREHGDIQIFSYESPEIIADLMLSELRKMKVTF